MSRRFAFAMFLCLGGMVLQVNGAEKAAPTADSGASLMPYPQLPEAISSFGATIADGHIYVFGGHVGRIPGNSRDGLSPHFCRIPVDAKDGKWESLPMHKSSQSPGLVTWNGNIYRVGGLSFRNPLGETADYESLDTFAKFDPKTGKWTELPSMPVPRSSLDAAVVDGTLYVVGGWNLQKTGAADAVWDETVVAFDLSNESGQWKTIAKPPFVTRALAAAGHKHKLYVLGGMNKDNGASRAVHIYDPATSTWSTGPELPGDGAFATFAISAFVANDTLYFSGGEGVVYRLNGDGSKWESVERLLFPRRFHRLVADNGRVYVMAGVATEGGYLANVEVVTLNEQKSSKTVAWSIPFEGEVKQGQALLLHGTTLYAFGGNRTREPHNFAKESFVDEAFAFNLSGQTVKRLENLPKPVQNAEAVLAGTRIDQSIYLFGGLGFEGEGFQSLDTVYQYRIRSESWMEEVRHLPTSRSLFVIAEHEQDAWMFGGNRVRTADKGLVAETWRWKKGSDDAVEVVQSAAIPHTRRSFGGAVLNGRFYAVGGISDSGLVDTAEAFDFASGTWQPIASPQVPRVFASLAAAGGKLYLFGGFTRKDGHFESAKSVEVYDPKSDTWATAFESLPFADRVGTMLSFQDRLLFYGIDDEKDGLAHFVLLDPAPETVGYGAGRPAPAEERSAGAELLERLMRRDANGDGKLTAEEVSERFRPLLKRADVNEDGFATREELEAALRDPMTTDGPGRPGVRPEGAGSRPERTPARQ